MDSISERILSTFVILRWRWSRRRPTRERGWVP